MKGKTIFTISLLVAIFVLPAGCLTAKNNKKQAEIIKQEIAIKQEIIKPEDQTAVNQLVLTIPPDTFNPLNVIWGPMPDKSGTFHKPRCINREELIKNTDEYQEIVKQAEKPGTAQYWKNIAIASGNITQKQIPEYAKQFDIDLVIDLIPFIDYLKTLEQFKGKTEQELVALFDITPEIKDYYQLINIEQRQLEETKRKEEESDLKRQRTLEIIKEREEIYSNPLEDGKKPENKKPEKTGPQPFNKVLNRLLDEQK